VIGEACTGNPDFYALTCAVPGCLGKPLEKYCHSHKAYHLPPRVMLVQDYKGPYGFGFFAMGTTLVLNPWTHQYSLDGALLGDFCVNLEDIADISQTLN